MYILYYIYIYIYSCYRCIFQSRHHLFRYRYVYVQCNMPVTDVYFNEEEIIQSLQIPKYTSEELENYFDVEVLE